MLNRYLNATVSLKTLVKREPLNKSLVLMRVTNRFLLT